MRIIFSQRAWDDYLYWQSNDRKMLDRVNGLIQETVRHPFIGIGKPEPLRGKLSGWWSRRLTREHRLVYRVADDGVLIAQCRIHYEVSTVGCFTARRPVVQAKPWT